MIVITGAAGQVGSMLVRKLYERGKTVKAIVTETDDVSVLEKFNIEIAVGDIRDVDFLIEEFRGATYVYHVAGIISITEGMRQLMEDVNVGGMKTSLPPVKRRM